MDKGSTEEVEVTMLHMLHLYLDVSGCISAGFSIILLIFFQSCLNMYVCLFLLMKYHDMPCQALLLDAQKVGMQGPEAQLKTARAAATSGNSCCAGYCAR